MVNFESVSFTRLLTFSIIPRLVKDPFLAIAQHTKRLSNFEISLSLLDESKKQKIEPS